MSKKKWSKVGLVAAAAALGASLAGNYFLNARLRAMEKLVREAGAKGYEIGGAKAAKTAPFGGASAAVGTPRRGTLLPATPILFKSATWRDDAVVLDFESESGIKSAALNVSPELPVRTSTSGKTIRISGKFIPGMKYRVAVAAGAENFSGGRLERDAVADITIPDLPAEVSFASSGTYLPLRGKKLALPFGSVNCDKVEATLYQAFENNLNPYAVGSSAGDARMVEVARRTIRLKTPKNREIFHELDLEALIGGRRPGVYRVTLNSAEQYVFVTDMAIQAVEDANSGRIAVFVRSLETGKPVAGAEIVVMSYKNQLAASGKTDENGSALLAYDPRWDRKADRTVSVTARKDGDISYFRLNDARTCDRDGDAVVAGAPRAFVFAERGIARPGEEFTASAFLRLEERGNFKVLADTPLEFLLLDPSGDKMLAKAAKSDRHGFARVGFALPETAATGVYTVVCRAAGAQERCGRTVIRVASYVPDRIKVSAKDLSGDRRGVEDVLDFEFDARYYFGAPLENGSYRYAVRSFPGAAPAHWDGSWSAGSPRDFTAAAALSGKGRKDKGAVRVRYPGFAAQGGTAFGPVRIEAAFEAAEPGGRSVANRVSRTLYPTPFFIGVREAEGGGAREKRLEYTLLPAEKCDTLKLPAGFTLDFELARREWEYVLVRDGQKWKRQWVERVIPLPERKLTATVPAGDFAVGKAAAIAWNGLPSGEYTLTAGSGASYRTRFDFSWYAGDGGERSANPGAIYFRTDAEQVAPGGTINFSFDAPGDGEAFLVYGERTLAGRRTLPVKSGRNTVAMQIPADIHSSSYFIGCTVVTRRGGNYNRSFGVLKVKVDQTKSHRLQVALEHADRTEPRAEFPIRLKLADASGRPLAGAVCLYAVDSGVVSLTEYRTPDIFRHFYGDIACPLAFYDMYGAIFEELRITPDGRIGGDADKSAARKLGNIKQKHTVRLIAPLVGVPASGTATVKVRLPDHTGELTIFAVASSECSVGSAHSAVVMREKATVRISAPRFVAPGDVAELAVTVFNHEADGSDFRCTVKLPPALEVVGGASNTFSGKDLGRGKQRTFTMPVRVRDDGTFGAGALAAELRIGTTVAKDDAFVTVRSVNVEQGACRLAVLKPGEEFKAEFSGDYIGRPVGSIRLSASPALAVGNALEWLNGYPHGCLEQTAAAAFPFLALPALAKVGLIDAKVADTNRHKAGAAYAKLLAMSLSDGSFAMWPGGTRSWDEATVFALHFIFEAEKRGAFAPDAAKRAGYLSWLRRQVNDADPQKRPLRAYAAYVLAVAGDRAFLAPARNLIEGAEKPDYAQLLAGGALVKGGYAALGAPAMRAALEAGCCGEEGVPTTCSDRACRLGMALYILMDCALPGEEPATRLAVELAKCIRPDGSAWGTTQANAWAALGLAAYAEKFPPVPAQAEISVGEQREQRTVSGAVTLPARNGTRIVNRSGGTLVAESLIRGIPRRTPPSGGPIRIGREYLNEKGEAVTSVGHGEKVLVRIRFESPAELENLAVADLLPAGLEIEDELLASRAATLPGTAAAGYGAFRPKRLEKRDDRFLAFGDTERGRGEIVYRTRAVIRGSFVIPPVHVEAMYRPEMYGIFSAAPGVFTVK